MNRISWRLVAVVWLMGGLLFALSSSAPEQKTETSTITKQVEVSATLNGRAVKVTLPVGCVIKVVAEEQAKIMAMGGE